MEDRMQVLNEYASFAENVAGSASSANISDEADFAAVLLASGNDVVDELAIGIVRAAGDEAAARLAGQVLSRANAAIAIAFEIPEVINGLVATTPSTAVVAPIRNPSKTILTFSSDE